MLKRNAIYRVALMAGHRGSAVVEDAYRARTTVVNSVEQRGDSRMGERGVADNGNDGLMVDVFKAELEPDGP